MPDFGLDSDTSDREMDYETWKAEAAERRAKRLTHADIERKIAEGKGRFM